MKLSERLLAIAHLVPPGSAVADVGTDHAYLPIYLVKNRISSKVIAVEARIGPWTRARDNVKRVGLEEFIEVRLGYGLVPIKPGEVEIAVIAGLGGETIWNIIEKSPDIVNTLSAIILQPMKNLHKLRKALLEEHFNIIEEHVVFSGNRFYEVMVAKKGKPVSFSDVDVVVGPVLKKKRTPEVLSYLKARINQLFLKLTKLEGKNSVYAAGARESIKKEIVLLQEVLKNGKLPDGN
ncbi:MAG: class I SAM-dependent methyltransferase [Thermosediminibacteraceae bacterium]|nr:class I SAM-dependent methyltransferase [Thermosediminibacteraceae bacterium]